MLKHLEQVHTAVPGFFRESFQNFNEKHAPWSYKVERTVDELNQVLQVTIKGLNCLAQHINDAFDSLYHSFNTLAEIVYPSISQTIA